MSRRSPCQWLAFVAVSGLTPIGGRGPVPAPAQPQQVPGGGLRAAVRLSADTVRVGEPFTVGLVAAGSEGVRLPRLLDAADGWEQLEAARIERGEDGEVRAYYPVVAWETGRVDLPVIEIATDGAAGRQSFRLELTGPWVSSVLPADAEDVKLRGPRPPRGDRFPWWVWLAVLAALILAAWWWRRRRRAAMRREVESAPVEVDPRERALAALATLREEAAAGQVGAAAFYDRLEEILRSYLSESRDWPPTRPVRASAWLSRGAMRELHRHAVMARFAGVGAPENRRLADVDTSIAWLRKDAA
jgi:hypothetical protein